MAESTRLEWTARMNTKTKFSCNCNGCRGHVKGNSLYRNYWQGLVIELGGQYFSPNNRKFHGSRITGWHYFYLPDSRDVYGVAIKETRKAGWDDSAGREYAVSLWCRYGELVDSYRQDSAREANKFMESAAALQLVKLCGCHGCTLDRDGR